MDWLKLLGDLSPTALLVVAVFIIAKYIVAPMLRSHEKAAETLANAHEQSTKTMKEGLDANTKAVTACMDHNEKIISNHLAKQGQRDTALLLEMRTVATAIGEMNHRHRKFDRQGEK
jgi:uncharacterized membrane protein YedE/YeeE